MHILENLDTTLKTEQQEQTRYQAQHDGMSHKSGASQTYHGKQNNPSISVTKPKPLMCAQTYLVYLAQS